MPNFIYEMPNFLLFFLICAVSIIISVVSMSLISRYLSMSMRNSMNEVAGYISATISMIYAIFFGFMALYLLENFDIAANSVEKEATVLNSIYHSSKVLPQSICREVQNEVEDYITVVLNHDWPSMVLDTDAGEESEQVLDKILMTLYNIHSKNSSDIMTLFILQEMIKEVKSMYEYRDKRLMMSHAALGADFWVVILLGAFLTIGVNYFFGMHFHFHVLSVIAVSIAVSSILFLLIAIDRPYIGDFSVKSEGFEKLLAEIKKDKIKGSCTSAMLSENLE